MLDASAFYDWGITDSRRASRWWPKASKLGGIPGVQQGLSRRTNSCSVILTASLPYGEWPATMKRPLIAPFAAADHYKAAVKEMKRLSLCIREKTELSKGDFRVYCNSGIPEKELTVLSGRGFQGKNTLHILPGKGSRHVLALLVFPGTILQTDQNDPSYTQPYTACGTCVRCASACPSGALKSGGGLNRERCLQYLSSRPGLLPEEIMEVWGIRIYGCDICQTACPHNSSRENPPLLIPDDRLTLTLDDYLRLGPLGLESAMKGTSLRFSWIDKKALFRNALLSAGHTKDPHFSPVLQQWSRQDDRVLADTARWALHFMEKMSAHRQVEKGTH